MAAAIHFDWTPLTCVFFYFQSMIQCLLEGFYVYYIVFCLTDYTCVSCVLHFSIFILSGKNKKSLRGFYSSLGYLTSILSIYPLWLFSSYTFMNSSLQSCRISIRSHPQEVFVTSPIHESYWHPITWDMTILCLCHNLSCT